MRDAGEGTVVFGDVDGELKNSARMPISVVKSNNRFDSSTVRPQARAMVSGDAARSA
jgi:hypothetical protein